MGGPGTYSTDGANKIAGLVWNLGSNTRVGEMKDPKVMFEDMLDSQVDWCAYLLARRAGLLSISVRRSFQAKNT